MDNPSLYRQGCTKPSTYSAEIINEFKNKLKWRLDGQDSLIDIGCGCGNLTTESILPILPPSFTNLTAIDKSSEMIVYAKKHYQHPKLTYEVLDIGANIDTFLMSHKPFDHLMSFFCLHWLQNQQNVANNIYKLLQSNGDFLLSFVAQSKVYDMYSDLSKSDKWKKYLTDHKDFLPPYHHSEDPKFEYGLVLKEAGFRNFEIEVRDCELHFDKYDEIKNLLGAINPFLNRIPTHLHDEYLNELVKGVECDHSKYIMKMNMMIVYGCK